MTTLTIEWTVEQAPSGNWICRNGRGRVYAMRPTEEAAQALVDHHRRVYNHKHLEDQHKDWMQDN